MGLGDYLRPLVSIGAAALGWSYGGAIGGAIGWGLGMGIGGALFPAEAERTAAQSLGPAQQLTPTANLGGVVPVVKGNRRIAGNLIWYDNGVQIPFESEAAQTGWTAVYTSVYGGTTAPGASYYVDFAIAACIGPAVITRFYIGKNEYVLDIPNGLIYRLNVGANVPVEYMNQSAASILAHLQSEGAASIHVPPTTGFTLYRGYQTAADSSIAASKGTYAPPYRNLCYIVFRYWPTSGLNAIPPMTFEATSLTLNSGSGVEETDVTPQNITAEILTNEFYGMGLDPTSYLETTVTGAAEAYATTNDMLLSIVHDNQRSVLDALQYVIQHHNGYIAYQDGKIIHGQLEIEGEAIAWATDASTSDAFTDNSTGTQWRKVD
jgi:hypothetical protein